VFTQHNFLCFGFVVSSFPASPFAFLDGELRMSEPIWIRAARIRLVSSSVPWYAVTSSPWCLSKDAKVFDQRVSQTVGTVISIFGLRSAVVFSKDHFCSSFLLISTKVTQHYTHFHLPPSEQRLTSPASTTHKLLQSVQCYQVSSLFKQQLTMHTRIYVTTTIYVLST
jgi:hypothetical protein